MKKTLAIALVVGVLSLGGFAYGHAWGEGSGSGWGGGPGTAWCGGPGWGGGPGGSGWCGGPGMMYGYGPGYGPMMGYGPGWGSGPGWNSPSVDYQSPEAKKFLAATEDLRKQLNDKMFNYREAYRSGDEKKAAALEKEIEGLRDQLRAKAKETGFTGEWGTHRGYGPRSGAYGHGPRGGGYGYGGCGGPYGRW